MGLRSIGLRSIGLRSIGAGRSMGYAVWALSAVLV